MLVMSEWGLWSVGRRVLDIFLLSRFSHKAQKFDDKQDKPADL